jgi:hypothetical protein
MKIAALVPSVAAGSGGTERCAAAMLAELARRGHEITLFTADARGAITFDTTVATIDASGVVTGVGSGQVTIAATANGVSGYALVTVSVPAVTPVTRWSTASSPTGNTLAAVWAAGPSEAWAVGSGGVAVHFDGTNWTGTLTGTTNSLYGVWGTGPGAVYAVGVQGRMLHHNGSVWDTLPRFTKSI